MTFRFPFGAPLTPCPPTKPSSGRCSALILGVYPSALHVRWKSADGSTSIASLAVDNEPSVFWDGTDQADRIDAWRKRWFDDAWGTATPTRLNGSSGAKINEEVLLPLELERQDVWFTDAVNTYYIKVNDSQGKAHSGRFKAFAEAMSLDADRTPHLPTRPTPAALVRTALLEHRERLLDEVQDSEAPLVVALGNEALSAIAGLAQDSVLPARLDHSGYGRRWPVRVGGRTIDVLPLKHPGNRAASWSRTHAAWASGKMPD